MAITDMFGESALTGSDESNEATITTTDNDSENGPGGFSDISAGFGQSALYGGDISDGLGQSALYSDETNDAAESTDELSRAAISIRSAVGNQSPADVVENATSNDNQLIPIPMLSGGSGGIATIAIVAAVVALGVGLSGDDGGN